MKRILFVMFLLGMVFLFFPACGGGDGDGSGPSEAGQWEQFEWDQGKWG